MSDHSSLKNRTLSQITRLPHLGDRLPPACRQIIPGDKTEPSAKTATVHCHILRILIDRRPNDRRLETEYPGAVLQDNRQTGG